MHTYMHEKTKINRYDVDTQKRTVIVILIQPITYGL
jgi:hypothetical protein